SEPPDQYKFGIDYLYGDSVMSLNYTNSSETDYEGRLFSLGVAHEVFAGMTTLKMGVGRGDDTVTSSVDDTFE
ncbi:MAG: DUF3570 domain-containing protein, partial [Xanthomonadales bacterium]|nr:DUF3570 domain-containing protein [Xanthomonadales bacterium]NIQ36754.1 DUF3570 domain-containing protein [Xanthomonadales bacterium]